MEHYHCEPQEFTFGRHAHLNFFRGDSNSTKLHVAFSFTCTFFVDIWKYLEVSDQPVFQERITNPVFNTDVFLFDNLLFNDPAQATRYLRFRLQKWPITHQQRTRLVTFAINSANYGILYMPPLNNVMRIHVPVKVIHRHVFGEQRVIDLAITRSIGEHVPAMAPTAEWAIQKLKVGVVRGEEHCAICLDEMKGGQEATSLPCGHVFHGDCIKHWLKKSHHCPICRFVMPTACLLA